MSNHPSQYFSNSCQSVAKALASTTDWSSSSTGSCLVGNNTSLNNTTGFNALPAGYYYDSYYGDNASPSAYYSSSPSVGQSAGFWSCTVAGGCWGRTIDYNSSALVRKAFRSSRSYVEYSYSTSGFIYRYFHDFLSVRCLRD